MKGKIVLLPFPFIDLTKAKFLPVLVIYEGNYAVLEFFISFKIPQKI